MEEKHLFSKREFLNKETYHSTAAVSATLRKSKYDDPEERIKYTPYEAEFYISNCDRSISLVMDVYNVESLENSIHKMQQIENTARQFREALEGIKENLRSWEFNRENHYNAETEKR